MIKAVLRLLQNPRFQGGGILISVFLFIWLILIQPTLEIINQRNAQNEQFTLLIAKHEKHLTAPLPRPDNDILSTYLIELSAEVRRQARLIRQTEISALIRENGGRIIEQRNLEDDVSINGLTGIRFRFQFEGDLQTLVEVLEDITQKPEPLFIDRIQIEARPGGNRPDSRLRVVLEFRLWIKPAKGEE